MKPILLTAAAIALLSLGSLPAAADSCSSKNISVLGTSIPGVTAEDCKRTNTNRDDNRASALAATQDQVIAQPGLNMQVVGAIGDFDSDAGAAGLNLNYVMDTDWAGGAIQKFWLGAGAGTLVNGEDQIGTVKVGISFGTFH